MLKSLVFGALIAALPASVMANDYSVNKFRYTNNGAYDAQVNLFYALPNTKYKCKLLDRFDTVIGGDAETFSIGGLGWYEAKNPHDQCKAEVPEGAEVWLEIDIQAGEKKSCRSENKRFFYHPDGGKARLLTAGTTQHNNRCKIKNKGGHRLD